MHELSIALNVIRIAEGEADRIGGRVSAVHLRIGALSGVAREALLFSYDVATADTPLAGSRLVIEEIPVLVYCSRCDTERQLPSPQLFVCPVCQSATPDIRAGRELQVMALEMVS
ncbi:MAG TPA: hydrogenase maturation nickel metallochaperone HypA [Gemmatimonadales bacterium]|jgi:hydrogenase nickel incorporation protein HypA/HybF